MEQALAAARRDIEHLEGTIRLFDSRWQSPLRKSPRRSRLTPFRMGELTRLLLDEMRRSGTALTARDLTKRLLTVKGITAEDRAVRDAIGRAVGARPHQTEKARRDDLPGR